MPEKVVSLFETHNLQRKFSKLNPERLQQARTALAMTQTDLANAVGVSRQIVSAYEQGAKSPDPETLIQISAVLQQPLSYFSADSSKGFGRTSVRTYRAFGAATKKRNLQCNVMSDWASEVVSYVDKNINFPSPQIPEMPSPSNGLHYTDEQIEQAAERVRSSWGLGVGPIGNLTKLIESRGIFVARLPVTEGTVNAFSYWAGDRPFIAMGQERTTAVRRRFDIAHELGHLVLHQGIGIEELEDKATLKQVEAEANRFAGAFLLPRVSYPNELFTPRLSSFVALKERWKVAISAQVFRCSDLGLLDDDQVLSLRKQISFKKWRTAEPLDGELIIEEPTMLSKAFQLAIDGGAFTPCQFLNDVKIGKVFVSNLLGVPISIFDEETPKIDSSLSIKK